MPASSREQLIIFKSFDVLPLIQCLICVQQLGLQINLRIKHVLKLRLPASSIISTGGPVSVRQEKYLDSTSKIQPHFIFLCQYSPPYFQHSPSLLLAVEAPFLSLPPSPSLVAETPFLPLSLSKPPPPTEKMGTHKKEAQRRTRQGDSSAGMSNVKTKGENFYRSAKKVKTLNMYKEGKPERDAAGNITKAASYQSRDVPSARVEPNRRWFNNSRVIGQDSLSAFRTAMSERAKDPYNVLLKTNKLPMSLIRDPAGGKNGVKEHGAKVAVQSAPFAETFGPKAQRKRVKMASGSLEDLAGETERMEERYRERVEEMRVLSGKATEGEGGVGEGGDRAQEEEDGTLTTAREPIFSKGQSKRIWNELYKVVDSSDVILHVLDARDPLGTRCWSVEKYIREVCPPIEIVGCC